MDKLRLRYYKYNIFFLSIICLWPYKNSRLKKIQRIFLATLLTCIPIVQVLVLIRSGDDKYYFYSSLFAFFVSMGAVCKYNIFFLYLKVIKEVLDSVRDDWNSLKNEEELQIITRFSSIGRHHTIIFALLLYPSSFGSILNLFSTTLLNVLIPLNESRPHRFAFSIDSFVDQEKHFYSIAFVTSCLLILVSTTFVATESISIMCLLHASGLFKIVSYRLKKAFLDTSVIRSKRRHSSYVCLSDAVDMHVRAVTFSKFLTVNFAPSYMILLVLGVTSLSVNLYRAITVSDTKQIVLASAFIISELSYMFYLNFIIQGVTESCSNIFVHLYDTNWYEADLPMQRMLLFIMLNSIEPVGFNFYGFYSGSVEGFSKIVKLSLSYFMTLHSIQ